ncbi:PREDICTED: transmembrane protein 8A-like isoform X1 [Polistes dominula]|uniref:Transmembrane protein 8A-like isoform X1 n=1 Tax=Polistes dominula TaxID=743375 RepID=A0ABM1IQB6_POLDO|nr:PREDICTED: transmembrane protein 8A-like isoform X1 [Polistes dominula]
MTVIFEKCVFSIQSFFYFSFFSQIYLLFLLPGTLCIIPEASQESILQPFKSYSDVAMFHYNVPKEVFRATWQFAAFTDQPNCPQRKVHIHLRWGSYPVLPIDNMTTFPTNMYPLNNDTLVISTDTYFEPESIAVIPVYGPQAGDWFVAAYLSPWDKKVQQQGLFHKCHYSIGSIALWVEASAIENVPVGYQTTLKTKETSSYYKIYVPSGISTLRVYIWGCNFTVHSLRNVHKPCIKNVALQGRVLPIFNNTPPSNIGNLTMLDSYMFTIFSPYEDSYYYLLIISDSIVEFNIKVSVSECPIKLMGKQNVEQYSLITEQFTQISETNIKQNQTTVSNHNRSSFYNLMDLRTNQFYIQTENSNTEDKCFPRYQLVRVKHSQIFSTSYLLQGKEWLTPWLALTDSYPVITQFNILPFVDIGGTLDINIHLEMYKTMTKQLIVVTVCIQKGHASNILENKIICEDEKLFMNLSSLNKHDESILIPYPQPDTWYISLQATCYLNNHPVNCEMEEILVSLNVHIRQCVFPGKNSCGRNGICQEIHRDLLVYTACNCHEGYKGWGCTDIITTNSGNSVITRILMLTLSNGFFIPAIYLAVKREFYTEGLIYLSTMLSSALYHACDQLTTNYCITKFEVLQYCDFFSSILAFWVTLVAMAELPIHLVSLCNMFGALLIAFEVQSDRTSLNSISIPLIIGIIIPVGTYIYRSYRTKNWKRPNRLSKLLIGSLLAGVGFLLFSMIETEANYQYIHSIWHMIIAISLLFLLPPARTQPLNNSNISSSSEDTELLDYKDYLDSPVFTVINGQDNLLIASR